MVINIKSSERQNPSMNQPLPFAPGMNHVASMMMEPLETTTRAFPTRGIESLFDITKNSESLVPLPQATPVDKNVDLNADGQLSLPEVQYAAFVHHGLSATVVKYLFSQV